MFYNLFGKLYGVNLTVILQKYRSGVKEGSGGTEKEFEEG